MENFWRPPDFFRMENFHRGFQFFRMEISGYIQRKPSIRGNNFTFSQYPLKMTFLTQLQEEIDTRMTQTITLADVNKVRKAYLDKRLGAQMNPGQACKYLYKDTGSRCGIGWMLSEETLLSLTEEMNSDYGIGSLVEEKFVQLQDGSGLNIIEKYCGNDPGGPADQIHLLYKLQVAHDQWSFSLGTTNEKDGPKKEKEFLELLDLVEKAFSY